MTSELAALLDLRIVIPASVQSIEEFFRSFRRQHGCICRDGENFTAELLLREALVNAVVHGSNSDADKQVMCRVRRRGSNLIIVVRDEGEGFDWQTVSRRGTPTTAVSGRGLTIFRKYANGFRYNAKGNSLAIWKKFNEGTKYD